MQSSIFLEWTLKNVEKKTLSQKVLPVQTLVSCGMEKVKGTRARLCVVTLGFHVLSVF